jgi:type II secretory pathway pseudopilin PulG
MIMLRHLKQLHKQAGGFTLVELVIGVMLVSLIAIAVAMTMGVMFKVSAGSSHRVTAIRQVQNAGMYITKDAQSAQTITIGGSHVLELLWTDWDGTKYKVNYDYDTVVTSDLVRKYYVKLVTDVDFPDDPTSTTVVAHYIDQGNTSFVKSGSVYELTVTSKIIGLSANGQPVSETRVYEVLPRTGA